MDLWFYGKDVKRKGLPRAGVMGKQRKRQRVDAGPKGPVGTSTPLHAACRGDDAGAVAAILEDLRAKKLAAAVDARDEHGRTPLHLACWAGRGDAAALLLDAGAGAALGAQDAMTALHFASQAGCVAAVERLVAAGAPLDAECTKSLKTPLHFAAAKGHAAAVAALLAAGADGAKKTRKGETALDLATSDDAKAAFATEPSAKPEAAPEVAVAPEVAAPAAPEVAVAPVVTVAPEVAAAQEVATPPAAASPAPVAAPPAPPAEDAPAPLGYGDDLDDEDHDAFL